MINKVQLEDGGGQREREGLYYLCVFSEGCFPADGSRGKNNRIFLFARILLPLEVVRGIANFLYSSFHLFETIK